MTNDTTIRHMSDTALQAAQEFGGYDLEIARATGATEDEVRAYFSRENFEAMFGRGQGRECDGWSLDECADAVISELGL